MSQSPRGLYRGLCVDIEPYFLHSTSQLAAPFTSCLHRTSRSVRDKCLGLSQAFPEHVHSPWLVHNPFHAVAFQIFRSMLELFQGLMDILFHGFFLEAFWSAYFVPLCYPLLLVAVIIKFSSIVSHKYSQGKDFSC